MDAKKRLLRKPVTTVSWIAVLTAMALLLGIGANMLHSAQSLLDIIDQHHTTIAVQTLDPGLTAMGNYHKLGVTLSRSEIEALEALDTVEKIDLRTLTGAYIPELTAQMALTKWGHVCQANYDLRLSETAINEAYNEVVFTGEVEYCWLQSYDEPWYVDMSRVGGTELMEAKHLRAIVNIDEILVAHPDYVFYPGEEENTYYTGKILVDAYVYSDSDEPCFKEGETYIFSGLYDPMTSVLVDNTPKAVFDRYGMNPSFPTLTLGSRYDGAPGGRVYGSDCLMLENGQMIMYRRIGWQDQLRQPLRAADARDPVVVALKLTTSVDDLVASEPQWAETIDTFQKVLHAFPVLGTEALETMYIFNRNDASMVSGRMFNQEEYDSAARVCVISEAVANQAGIEVGDTLHFSQYICARSLDEGNQSVATRDAMTTSLNNPTIGRIPFPGGFKTEDEEFTVVGIYKLQRTWDSSAFSVTPNTIFIPQKAQTPGGYGGPSYTAFGNGIWEFGESFPNGTYGVYLSVQVKNGQAEAFQAQADEVAPNNFHLFDQGYAAAEESVRQVAVEARKLIGIASIGWLLLLTLYILLYQNKERSNLGILRSIGGAPKIGRRYLFGSGFLLAAVGITIGTLGSSFVTRLVSRQLAEFMVSEGTMQAMSGGMELGAETMAQILGQASLPISTLLTLAAAQLAVIALSLWGHAAVISCQTPRKLMGV